MDKNSKLDIEVVLWLKRWMYENDLTMVDAGKTIGCSGSSINRIIHGGNFDRKTAWKIARVTGNEDEFWKMEREILTELTSMTQSLADLKSAATDKIRKSIEESHADVVHEMEKENGPN